MPVTAIHPGEHLAEELGELGMSAAELARQLEVPTNTKSNTLAPNSRAISRVRSFDPVSTTTISSNSPATDDKHLKMFASSSLTIIVRLTETGELLSADFADERR